MHEKEVKENAYMQFRFGSDGREIENKRKINTETRQPRGR